MRSLRRGCIRSKKRSFSVGETFRGLGKGGKVKKKKKNQHKCQHLPRDHGSFISCTEKFSRPVISCHPVFHSSPTATGIYSAFTLEHLLKHSIRRANQTVLQQLGRWVFSVAQCLVVPFYIFLSFQQAHLLQPPCLLRVPGSLTNRSHNTPSAVMTSCQLSISVC